MGRSSNVVRIIGGEHKRRQLKVLDRPGLRPTPDRVRETLFNWLAPVLPGARVLDLFAGSGVLGLEALSRGAAGCDLVEKDGGAARLIGDNLAMLRLEARGKAHNLDAMAFLRRKPELPYDLVFLDPPYASDLLGKALTALAAPGWLAEEARVYVELPARLGATAVPESWTLLRQGDAGEVGYYLYSLEAVD
ncbi:MAG: 16S rRNA (guanine(966)-N(2))-methyltransferase RsmD [Pseudomonadota bacterium]